MNITVQGGGDGLLSAVNQRGVWPHLAFSCMAQPGCPLYQDPLDKLVLSSLFLFASVPSLSLSCAQHATWEHSGAVVAFLLFSDSAGDWGCQRASPWPMPQPGISSPLSLCHHAVCASDSDRSPSLWCLLILHRASHLAKPERSSPSGFDTWCSDPC